MWDSQYTDWNAAQMGPKQDIVTKLAQAIRKQDMRFMVALHHAENWWFFPEGTVIQANGFLVVYRLSWPIQETDS